MVATSARMHCIAKFSCSKSAFCCICCHIAAQRARSTGRGQSRTWQKSFRVITRVPAHAHAKVPRLMPTLVPYRSCAGAAPAALVTTSLTAFYTAGISCTGCSSGGLLSLLHQVLFRNWGCQNIESSIALTSCSHSGLAINTHKRMMQDEEALLAGSLPSHAVVAQTPQHHELV